MTLAIEADGLVKSFGDTRAVDGIDLSIRAGTVYGVLGPNGAGKTTTIRMLATLLRPGRRHGAGPRPRHRHRCRRSAREDEPDRAVRVGRRGADGPREPPADRSVARARQGPSGRSCRQPARRLRPAGRRRQAGPRLLGRHAPASRPGQQHRRDPRAALPRRADDRARSAQPQPGLGHRARPRRRGRHRPADDAVPGRGRPAGRPAGDHRPRPGDRRGHAGRAEGVGGSGLAARARRRDRPALGRPAGAGRGARRAGAAGLGSRRAVCRRRRRRSRRRRARRAVACRHHRRRAVARPAQPRRGLPRPHRPPGRVRPTPRSRPDVQEDAA